MASTSNPQSSHDSTSSEPQDGKTNDSKTQRYDIFNQLFLWPGELIAAILSMLCLAGMIAMLTYLQDRKLSVWTLSISPNALLAIFSTISKGSVFYVLTKCVGQLKWIYFRQSSRSLRDFATFDSASRSSMGSLLFLFRLRLRAVVASVGAVLTVVTVAMEPFTQQILSYPSHVVAIDNSVGASLPVIRALDNITTSPPVSNLLYRALYAPINEASGYTCVNNNCAWRDFTTLQICSSCEDVTQTITKTCSEREIHREFIKDQHWDKEIPPNHNGTGIFCEYSLPVNPKRKITKHLKASGFLNYDVTPIFQTTATQQSAKNLGSSWAAHAPGAITTISILEVQPVDAKKLGVLNFTDKGFQASGFQCTLRWCARSQAGLSIINGSLHEEGVAYYNLKPAGCTILSIYEPDPAVWCAMYLPHAYPTEHLSLTQLADRINTTLREQASTRNPQMFPLQTGAQDQFQFALFLFFGGPDTTEFKTDLTFYPELLGKKIFDTYRGNYSLFFAKYTAELNKWLFAQVAPRAKVNGDVLRSSLGGEIKVEKTFVHVTWPWLILPAGTVFLSALFLLTTIFLSMYKESRVWKTSALAPLYHGLDDWPKNEPTWTESNMLRLADVTTIRLAPDDEGHPLLRHQEYDENRLAQSTSLVDRAPELVRRVTSDLLRRR